MPKTTSAQGWGTRGSRRSRGSRSGLVVMHPSSWSLRSARPPCRAPSRACERWGARGSSYLLLVLQFAAHRFGQLVPGVDELLHALVLQHAEDVVEVHP